MLLTNEEKLKLVEQKIKGVEAQVYQNELNLIMSNAFGDTEAMQINVVNDIEKRKAAIIALNVERDTLITV